VNDPIKLGIKWKLPNSSLHRNVYLNETASGMRKQKCRMGLNFVGSWTLLTNWRQIWMAVCSQLWRIFSSTFHPEIRHEDVVWRGRWLCFWLKIMNAQKIKIMMCMD